MNFPLSGMQTCQSCGKPMKKDEGRGTEVDGSRSAKFCSHCYIGGQFTLPSITAGQMQERVRDKLVEMGFPKFLTGFFTRGIPKLERWSAVR